MDFLLIHDIIVIKFIIKGILDIIFEGNTFQPCQNTHK